MVGSLHLRTCASPDKAMREALVLYLRCGVCPWPKVVAKSPMRRQVVHDGQQRLRNTIPYIYQI
jgi:hypothetical protein